MVQDPENLRPLKGELELKKPQIREFPFETKVFERYSRVEKALDSVILESYIQGVSTRNVMNVVESLGVEYFKTREDGRYGIW